MTFGNDNGWHHNVHQQLGEQLHYYFVRVRPFVHTEVLEILKKLIADKQVGSVRVFKLFWSV